MCDRLVKFRKKIAIKKRKQFIHETYWGKPITGYGDTQAQLLLVGLAPAAHGGTRTGRVFTGDKSAEFLFRCLFKSKLSNQPTSEYKNDDLILYNTYLTPALKCAPPLKTNLPIESLKIVLIFLKKKSVFLAI